MKLNLFNYELPKELIATEPAKPRDAARLFVYNRLDKNSIHPVRDLQGEKKLVFSHEISNGVHTFFNKINEYFKKGDVLVLNNTKVIPARLIGRLVHSDETLGRKFKILLLAKKNKNVWTALIDGRGRVIGLKFDFGNNLLGKTVKNNGGGIWEIKFNKSGKILEELISKIGQMPLPPYIKQDGYKKENKDWYQTVFAKYAGSVAAPTAGLHFTPGLLKKLKTKGVKIEYVTLHVGMGTFMPVKTEKVEEHKMHKELAIISPKTAKILNNAKKKGGKIIACGTTAARTLESFAFTGKIRAGKKYTNIFIYPPYKPKFVDGLITNFHLPKSTLMMLVSAFLSPRDTKGIKILQTLYQEAIKEKYKFYSYGDAMLIN